MLRRTCMALLATTLLATPAVARDKTLYLGVELGATWGSDTDVDAENVLIAPGQRADFDNFIEIDHKMGWDAGLIFGYDAGLVRAELDLSHRSVSMDEVTTVGFVGSTPTVITLDGDGDTSYTAIMANLLLDLGNEDGLSFYIGPGF